MAFAVLLIMAGSVLLTTEASAGVVDRLLSTMEREITSGECPTIVSANPCKNFGVCQNVPGGHTCLCRAGWTGPTCEQDGGSVIGKSLISGNGYQNYGQWIEPIQCKKGYFTFGFRFKFQQVRDNQDNTAMNRLMMLCGPPYGSRSDVQFPEAGLTDFGDWTGYYMCPSDYFVVGQQVDQSMSETDKMGVTSYAFVCRGPGLNGTNTMSMDTVRVYGGTQLEFSPNPIESCDVGQAICPFQLKALPKQTSEVGKQVDDMGICDTLFYCCKF